MLLDHLTYHFPSGIITIVLSDDERKLHRQLVCWCQVERYWYYVLHTPQIIDGEYDEVENHIKQMEEEYNKEYDTHDYFRNPYSPAKLVGSGRKEDYCKLVRMEFNNAE